jgi:RNA polymerase sigma-70 factor (sigma-E family)
MEDERLFAEFVKKRVAALYRYGFTLAGNHHDADDLVQDALIRLRVNWHRIIRKDDPTGYVRTTMTRLYASGWQRRRREVLSFSMPERAVTDAALDRVEDHDRISRIRAELGELPRRQREVLVLRYYVQLSDEEIAAILGVTRGTVRSQASRALEKLRIIQTAAPMMPVPPCVRGGRRNVCAGPRVKS